MFIETEKYWLLLISTIFDLMLFRHYQYFKSDSTILPHDYDVSLNLLFTTQVLIVLSVAIYSIRKITKYEIS